MTTIVLLQSFKQHTGQQAEQGQDGHEELIGTAGLRLNVTVLMIVVSLSTLSIAAVWKITL